jgi:hypothetical protein
MLHPNAPARQAKGLLFTQLQRLAGLLCYWRNLLWQTPPFPAFCFNYVSIRINNPGFST